MITRLCYGKKDYPFNYSEFVCDDESDLINLPTNKKKFTDKLTCSVGSKALVVETKKTYILNNNNEWKEISINMAIDTFTFTLQDGTEVVKEVYIKS